MESTYTAQSHSVTLSKGSSDLDVLVVTSHDNPDPTSVQRSFASLNLPESILGLELTTVSIEDLGSTHFLKPFQYHLNIKNQGIRYVIGNGHPGDADLVLHYEVARRVGIPILGPPAENLFPPQSRNVVLQALAAELEWALENNDVTYAVLNSARAHLYVRDGRMCSKLDGWLRARTFTEDAEYFDVTLLRYLSPKDVNPSLQKKLPNYESWAHAYVESIKHEIQKAI
ncbi:MAG: hypothetical protein WDO06_05055 [Actinomycetota bacterium]